MQILIIEDDRTTSKTIEMALKSKDYSFHTVDNGQEAIELARREEYDLLILDLGLPDISGYDVLKRLRNAKVTTPILILSGYSETDAKVKGFGGGADDYLTKPFNKDELNARVLAIVRRSKGHHASCIEIGQLKIDLEDKTVEGNGRSIDLTKREYAILELLAMRRGSTLSKEVFLNNLYGASMDELDMKIIDVFVCKLRKKIAKALNQDNYIKTVWGRGYVLEDPKIEEKRNHANTSVAFENSSNTSHESYEEDLKKAKVR
ncbi:MAG: response regulator transcription factor [Janthinobacterium lividum]